MVVGGVEGGRCIHQHVIRDEGIAIEGGEGTTGEEAIYEEEIMDAPKELGSEEGAISPMVKRGTLGRVGTNAGGATRAEDAPTTQIPSIDTLLRDIYELQYQLT